MKTQRCRQLNNPQLCPIHTADTDATQLDVGGVYWALDDWSAGRGEWMLIRNIGFR